MARKGIQPEFVSPDYLSAPKRPLSDFAMICVTNFGQIDRSGVEELEKYVKKGGGVFFATGPMTRGELVNQDLYRGGEGLFPLPLAGVEPLVVDTLDNTPDVQSEEHYVFHNMEHRVENLSKIFVQQYFAARDRWSAKDDTAVRVIMRLRNGAPLLVEKSVGHGRVLAFLSSISGTWNNWSAADTGSFPAFVLNMVPYLSHRFGAGDALLVGEPKTLTFRNPPFEPTVHFSGPGGDVSAATIVAEPSGKEKELRTPPYTKTETAGFYQARLTQPSHKTEVRNFAVNVDAAEGDSAGPHGARAGLPPGPFEICIRIRRDVRREARRDAGPQSGRFLAAVARDRARRGAMLRLVVRLPPVDADGQPLDRREPIETGWKPVLRRQRRFGMISSAWWPLAGISGRVATIDGSLWVSTHGWRCGADVRASRSDA